MNEIPKTITHLRELGPEADKRVLRTNEDFVIELLSSKGSDTKRALTEFVDTMRRTNCGGRDYVHAKVDFLWDLGIIDPFTPGAMISTSDHKLSMQPAAVVQTLEALFQAGKIDHLLESINGVWQGTVVEPLHRNR